MGAQPLDIIDDPARARTALQPIRLRLLHLLERPQSAPQLAKAMGMPRQRVLYHLRTLEAKHLVEANEHGSVGRRIDRSYVRTATSYAIAPRTLGGVAVDPRTVADAFSATYLSAVAGRALNDLAALGRAAAARGKRVPTLTLETDVRFATPADQRQFADELTTALSTLAAKYHDPDAPLGRTFRVFACGYPAVPSHPASPERSREAETEGGREADMEAK
jgi:DNA-binding transcriptional ArsR family regulator